MPTLRLVSRAARLGLLAVAGVAVSGCFIEDELVNCSLALFTDGAELTATVVPAATAAEGSYRLAIEAEDEVLATTVHWSPSGARCEGSCELEGERIIAHVGPLGGSRVAVLVRFAAAPGGPSEIALTVDGDTGTGSALVRPSYLESEPNGEGCGIWTRAQESIALPLAAE